METPLDQGAKTSIDCMTLEKSDSLWMHNLSNQKDVIIPIKPITLDGPNEMEDMEVVYTF